MVTPKVAKENGSTVNRKLPMRPDRATDTSPVLTSSAPDPDPRKDLIAAFPHDGSLGGAHLGMIRDGDALAVELGMPEEYVVAFDRPGGKELPGIDLTLNGQSVVVAPGQLDNANLYVSRELDNPDNGSLLSTTYKNNLEALIQERQPQSEAEWDQVRIDASKLTSEDPVIKNILNRMLADGVVELR